MSEPDSGIRTVLVTAPNVDVGADLARRLVDARLAACVNVVPGVRSIYRWEGEVHEDTEAVLIIKTAAGRCEELASRIEELHPYDLPEVLVFAATGGSARYLAWVEAETRS
jgi:periplasmic divalent cation tolerance protein